MPTRESVDMKTRERLRLHLLALMKEHGLNKNQMAERLGVHRGTLGSIASGGKTMGLDVLIRVHRVFGVSSNRLLDTDPDE